MKHPVTERLFSEYADYHRHPTNVLTHVIGIPLIVFHLVAMLDWLTLFSLGGLRVSFALLAYAAVMAWYWKLDRGLLPWMALWFGLCFPLGWITPVWLVVVAAIIGWVTQLAGHLVWEKRSPAFLTNLKQALIGPLYFADKVRTRLRGAPAKSS